MTPLAWMDVISSDIERTLAYYAGLFGWSNETLMLDHGEGYRVVRSGEVIVAGAEQVAAERKLEPVWTVMVESEDARSLIESAVAAGATETFELAPMLDLGRIAMLRDPWGATLGVWESGSFRPSMVPDVPGRLAGAVLTTPEPDASARFHREVFGWTPMSGLGDLDAGVPVIVERGHANAVWTPILSGDVDRAPLDDSSGSTTPRLADAGLARCADPTGATFYLFSGAGPATKPRRPSRVACDNPRGPR